MKFLFFTLEYPPFKGGVANYYYNLVKHAPKEHEVFVLDNNENKLINKGVIKWLPAIQALKKELQNNNKSELHVVVGQILPLGTVTWLLSLFYNFEYSVVLHGMDLEYTKRYAHKSFLAKKILKKAKTIICNSNYVAGLAEEFLGDEFKDKIKVVNPGAKQIANVKCQMTNEIFKSGTKLMLFSLGRLVKRKGVDMVIQAMPMIIAEVPYLEYYIAGTGPDEKYLKEERDKLEESIKKKIHFLGKISEAEKWQYLRKCDIFIMPNRNINGDTEGFGIVFLEANLSGKPVIGGKSGGTTDAIIDGETGFLVDSESVDEITDTVISLSRNIVQRMEMGDEGMKRVLSCFRWEDKAKQFYDMINSKR